MNIRPLPGYVLILPEEEEQMTSGGIALPETSKDKPMKGKVVAIEPYAKYGEVVRVETPADISAFEIGQRIKKGTTVIYKKWTNQEVEHEGKKYLLVHFNELLGVIE